ncbi:MAG TPA: PIN domain-containing protein [Miltoncostaeales bacterium]|jgi:toxin-antitoxin system PIN domain toxin|nr:PIN domain-containing protein [Miltoncostaeales bacterium]
MKAVDTNVLIYAHREDSEWHAPAAVCLRQLAEGHDDWAIPWPCLHEFLAIVTHPRVYAPPTPTAQALDQVQAWLESPTLVVLTESRHHWDTIRSLMEHGRVVGPLVHDARVAAICIQHGVSEILTADRDFGRFPALKTVNPLVAT